MSRALSREGIRGHDSMAPWCPRASGTQSWADDSAETLRLRL